MRRRSLRSFWAVFFYYLSASELATCVTYAPYYERPHSNLYKLRDTVATFESALAACESPRYTQDAFEKDCMSPASEALSSTLADILTHPSSYTREVSDYQKTLEEEDRMHTEQDTDRQNEIIRESSRNVLDSYESYVKLLCESALPKLITFKREWRGKLASQEEGMEAVTHRCELSSSYGFPNARLEMKLWIQSVKIKQKPIQFYNSLNLIGVLDTLAEGKNFAAIEVVSFRGRTGDDITAGVLPVPDYSLDSYLRKWSQLGFFAEKGSETKRGKFHWSMLFDFGGEEEEEGKKVKKEVRLEKWEEEERDAVMGQVDGEQREKVKKFYKYLVSQDGILLNHAEAVYSYNLRAIEEHYSNPHFNHMRELRLVCDSIRGNTYNWANQLETTGSSANTALCIVQREDTGYRRHFWIRTASDIRSTYFVGEWDASLDRFEPFDVIYKHDPAYSFGLSGALPPLNEQEQEMRAQRKMMEHLKGRLAQLEAENEKLRAKRSG